MSESKCAIKDLVLEYIDSLDKLASDELESIKTLDTLSRDYPWQIDLVLHFAWHNIRIEPTENHPLFDLSLKNLIARMSVIIDRRPELVDTLAKLSRNIISKTLVYDKVNACQQISELDAALVTGMVNESLISKIACARTQALLLLKSEIASEADDDWYSPAEAFGFLDNPEKRKKEQSRILERLRAKAGNMIKWRKDNRVYKYEPNTWRKFASLIKRRGGVNPWLEDPIQIEVNKQQIRQESLQRTQQRFAPDSPKTSNPAQ